MWDQNIGPQHDGLKRTEIEERLDLDLEYNVKTSLHHLEEIEAIDGVTPDGPEYYAISERLDEIVLGRVDEVASADIEALIEHIQDDDSTGDDETPAVADGGGPSLRSVVADEFDIVLDALEEYLRQGDQVEKLNMAVDAIEDHETVEKRDTYDRIIFRRGAHRYRLSTDQVERYQRENEDWEL